VTHSPTERLVVVTGVGAVSALAHTWRETWQALLAGASGVAPITLFDASDLPVRIAAEVKGWDAPGLGRREARHMDRSTQFALVAAREALEQAGLTGGVERPERFAVIVGSATGGLGTIHEQMQALAEGGYRKVSAHFLPNMLADSPAAHLALAYGARGPNLAVVNACATGATAIGEAAALIRRGDADTALAGGTEACITPLFMAGFNKMRALATPGEDGPAAACKPFDRRRDGLVVGEGAAILVLEEATHAAARGAQPLATVAGYGGSCDAYHMAAPDPAAEGMTQALVLALRSADLVPEDVDYIAAHGTGTPLNDRLETAAIKRALGARASTIPVSSTKGATGHLMGASGALGAAVCVQAILNNIVPPTINLHEADPACDLDAVPGAARAVMVRIALCNAFGMGGHNTSLVFREPV
jgi:3-oxoacyl-[acyl-carrier-protein] synthase II